MHDQKFLNNKIKPNIIRVISMLFLNISLDSLCLIFVPKYCPIIAGTIKKKLRNKSFNVPST